MDSMKSLNTSLPSANSSRPIPPEQLLQAFKSAALSVTNLYKSAVSDQSNSRTAGYQDCLDDLLQFLDYENLGLQDGEGWIVRQWVTERYDGTANQPATENESERNDSEQQQHQNETTPVPVPGDEPAAEATADASMNESTTDQTDSDCKTEPMFKFMAGGQASRIDDIAVPSSSQPENETSSPPAIRIEYVNRTQRTSQRKTGHRMNRSQIREINPTAGTKRKIQFPDFFDISSLGPDESAAITNKRSRLS